MIPPKAPLSAPPPVPITLRKLLLTEGDTPTHFCEAMLRHLGLSDSIEVRNFGGVNNLKAALAAFAASAEFQRLVESLGIIRDAEKDAAAARESVNHAIGTATIPARVRVSIFILPDNAAPGMIETLCMNAVRTHTPLASEIGCVDTFFKCLESAGRTFADPFRIAKHHAQAFLATRPESQMFPGLAAYRGYWPWDSPAFDPLKQFLQSL